MKRQVVSNRGRHLDVNLSRARCTCVNSRVGRCTNRVAYCSRSNQYRETCYMLVAEQTRRVGACRRQRYFSGPALIYPYNRLGR